MHTAVFTKKQASQEAQTDGPSLPLPDNTSHVGGDAQAPASAKRRSRLTASPDRRSPTSGRAVFVDPSRCATRPCHHGAASGRSGPSADRSRFGRGRRGALASRSGRDPRPGAECSLRSVPEMIAGSGASCWCGAESSSTAESAYAGMVAPQCWLRRPRGRQLGARDTDSASEAARLPAGVLKESASRPAAQRGSMARLYGHRPGDGGWSSG